MVASCNFASSCTICNSRDDTSDILAAIPSSRSFLSFSKWFRLSESLSLSHSSCEEVKMLSCKDMTAFAVSAWLFTRPSRRTFAMSSFSCTSFKALSSMVFNLSSSSCCWVDAVLASCNSTWSCTICKSRDDTSDILAAIPSFSSSFSFSKWFRLSESLSLSHSSCEEVTMLSCKDTSALAASAWLISRSFRRTFAMSPFSFASLETRSSMVFKLSSSSCCWDDAVVASCNSAWSCSICNARVDASNILAANPSSSSFLSFSKWFRLSKSPSLSHSSCEVATMLSSKDTRVFAVSARLLSRSPRRASAKSPFSCASLTALSSMVFNLSSSSRCWVDAVMASCNSAWSCSICNSRVEPSNILAANPSSSFLLSFSKLFKVSTSWSLSYAEAAIAVSEDTSTLVFFS